LALSTGKDVEAISATALALAGNASQATRLANDLSSHFPEDTIVQFNYVPTIRAAAVLQSHNAAKALEALVPSVPYELGSPAQTVSFALYLVYLRGEAYVGAHQGASALAEFQKIIDHYGVVGNEPISSLAHLGLARAYVLSGDATKAKIAYQDFLALWKDADPNIPILTQARVEYAKLQ
jgi:ATP/maltotriose-dependent transcriptional regulator MalT